MKYVVPLALFALLSTPVFAEPLEAPTARVAYSDLDLSTEMGRVALELRIQQTINELCPRGDVRDLAMQQYVERCRNTAENSVNPQLAHLYAARKVAQGGNH